MTVKDYLNQVFALDRNINSMKEQIEMLREESTSIQIVLSEDKVQSFKVKDKVGGIVASIIDLENEYIEAISQRLSLKAEIIQNVEKIDDIRHKLVLRERYINLKRWEDIAEDNSYTVDWLHKLHRKALKDFERVYSSIL